MSKENQLTYNDTDEISKYILSCFEHAKIHQDVLVHLFNPANDGKTSHKFETIYGEITMYNSVNHKYEMSKVKPLPNFAEFKLLLAILCYSQKIRRRKVSFNSANELLREMGYPSCGDNIELLNRTAERYQWFRIHYEDSLILDSVPEGHETITFNPNLRINKNKKEKRYTVDFGILVGVTTESKKGNTQTFVFTSEFWEICNGSYGFTHQVNLAVVKELRSPRQLQIYLYLCKWMNRDGFAQWSPVSIEIFVEETGLFFNTNDLKRYITLANDIRQTLKTVFEIDCACRENSNNPKLKVKKYKWDIKLRESIYKTSRRIQFVSPMMICNPPNSKKIDAEVMRFSEWKELFPNLTDYLR